LSRDAHSLAAFHVWQQSLSQIEVTEYPFIILKFALLLYSLALGSASRQVQESRKLLGA
jgi:hypothetical protein